MTSPDSIVTTKKLDLLWVDHYGSDWVGIYVDGVKIGRAHV